MTTWLTHPNIFVTMLVSLGIFTVGAVLGWLCSYWGFKGDMALLRDKLAEVSLALRDLQDTNHRLMNMTDEVPGETLAERVDFMVTTLEFFYEEKIKDAQLARIEEDACLSENRFPD